MSPSATKFVRAMIVVSFVCCGSTCDAAEKGQGVEIPEVELLHPVAQCYVPLEVGAMDVLMFEQADGGELALVSVKGFNGKEVAMFPVSLSSDPERASAQKRWASRLAFQIAMAHLRETIGGPKGPGKDDLVLSDSNQNEG